MKNVKPYRHGYWRSLEHRAMGHEDEAESWREWEGGEPPKQSPGQSGDHVPVSRLSRRGFFGASAALAGAAAASGCIRKPVEKIIPFSKRPEDTIPGNPLYYASAAAVGPTVLGLLVESQDGRPTKIEGNPRHNSSQGATDVFVQAHVREVYDPERTRAPLKGAGEAAEAITWDEVRATLGEKLKAKGTGKGLGLVVPQVLSPTMRQRLAAFRERFPAARVFLSDHTAPVNANAAAEMVAAEGARTYHSLAGTHVVFAADSDFLNMEHDHVRLSREWSKTRRVQKTTDFMSRLYVAEPHFTGTGVMADHRVRVKGSEVGEVMIALAKKLSEAGVDWPAGGEAVVGALRSPSLPEGAQPFVDTLASDLADAGNKGKSAVLVGERQPAWVHALGYLVNAALRNQGASLRWIFDAEAPKLEPIAALAGAGLDTVVVLDANPAYDSPSAAQALGGVDLVHFGLWRDETGMIADLHVPVSHWLEAWGDLQTVDGTVSIQQPLIAPLHDTYSVLEWMGFLASAGSMYPGEDLLKDAYEARAGGTWSIRSWRRWLHDGVVTGIPREPALPQQTGWNKVAEATGQGPVGGLEVNFHLSPKVLDGRHANNGWMQELPHPATKVTWGNVAMMSKATADKLGLGLGDVCTVSAGGAEIKLPTFIAPGQAEDTVSLTLGYGRTWGKVAKEVGANAGSVRGDEAAWMVEGQVGKAGGYDYVVTTQDHGTMKPHVHVGIEYPERPIALEATRKEWEEKPGFVGDVNLIDEHHLEHLWEPPALTGKQQWAMSIDLNTCTGCNACVVACQAENNIPVVGKEQVSNGREMHWIRLDRYYRGDENDPTAVLQPMLCQHCESAPCETVCPVAATVHSPEGLNEMAYNRCIGTRYCSNNCPYKVRRYNFFHYNLDKRPGWVDDDVDGSYLRQMQMNPDVTVRFRGVMEKCTYCVQRINQAKIAAHVAGKDKVPDGEIVTACQQACPTGAIVFGDKNDPDSAVRRAKDNSRNYQLLRDLNNGPRTTYLARIRNPHPNLGEQRIMVGREEGDGADDHAEGKAGH